MNNNKNKLFINDAPKKAEDKTTTLSVSKHNPEKLKKQLRRGTRVSDIFTDTDPCQLRKEVKAELARQGIPKIPGTYNSYPAQARRVVTAATRKCARGRTRQSR